MLEFPRLKTSAVLQYPAAREFRVPNVVLRFVDGNQQGYRDCASPLRKWHIRLELLDEIELATLHLFFQDCQGGFASFRFVDPWDGTEYEDCSLEQDEFQFELTGEMRGRTTLVVKQNRS
jgi:hypothetical protein